MTTSGSSSRPSSPEDRPSAPAGRVPFRLVAAANLMAGVVYLSWRYASSLNPEAILLSLLLLFAESYGFLDALLYTLTMWKPLRRSPPPPLEGSSVDVFITTYNEPAEIVRRTVAAAVSIDWSPLSVYILDDGAREEIRALAAELGAGYITRGEEWTGRNRHAKAGNVNNALAETGGEFILILDADQIPEPRIVSRLIGYFRDPRLAFVQSPQSFYNIPPGDPFGSDAELFYGPIMRGKDGWNAAFFCGSNALLRREALMQVGLLAYAEAAEAALRASLASLRRGARRALFAAPEERRRGRALRRTLKEAAARLAAGESFQAISERLGADLPGLSEEDGSPSARPDLGLSIQDEALAVEGVSTVSVTEDMATALRLHSAGWLSAFHSEILAHGLAPEDLGASLAQRLRWAQGTIQVLFRYSPLSRKGLALGQRLQYAATIFSYFSGFSNFVFVLCPIVFLFTGISPVRAWSLDFFLRFLPFYALNRLMFYLAAEGLPVRRGEQYNLGLFPLWIKAVLGVVLGEKIAFAVTPKTRRSGNYLALVRPQLAIIALSAGGLIFAALGLLLGRRNDLLGSLVNAFWACYNIFQLFIIVRAAVYAPPADWNPRPPLSGREKGESDHGSVPD